jgi:hypothetical protein
MTRALGTIDGVKGQALREENPGCEAARNIFNGLIDRRPAAIVRPVDAAMQRWLLRTPESMDCPSLFVCGGHNVAGNGELSMITPPSIVDLPMMRSKCWSEAQTEWPLHCQWCTSTNSAERCRVSFKEAAPSLILDRPSSTLDCNLDRAEPGLGPHQLGESALR